MSKITHIGLAAIPVLGLAGCMILGHDTSNPEVQKQAVEGGTSLLQTVAVLAGQPWAAALIGTIGGIVATSMNAHHGLRNVSVASAKGVGKLVGSLIKKNAPTV